MTKHLITIFLILFLIACGESEQERMEREREHAIQQNEKFQKQKEKEEKQVKVEEGKKVNIRVYEADTISLEGLTQYELDALLCQLFINEKKYHDPIKKDRVVELIQAGANPNEHYTEKWLEETTASQLGIPIIGDIFEYKKVYLNGTPVKLAIDIRDLELVEILHQNGATLEAEYLTRYAPFEFWEYYATKGFSTSDLMPIDIRVSRSEKIVNFLLNRGLDVNQPLDGKKGHTLLTAMCTSELTDSIHYPIMKLLVDKGANVNYIPKDGNHLPHWKQQNALFGMIYHTKDYGIKCFELLLNSGVKLTSVKQFMDTETCLEVFAKRAEQDEQLLMMKALLPHCKEQFKDYQTQLNYALIGASGPGYHDNNTKILQLIIDEGAELVAHCEHTEPYNNAFVCAIGFYNDKNLELLLEHYGHLLKKDKYYQSCIKECNDIERYFEDNPEAVRCCELIDIYRSK